MTSILDAELNARIPSVPSKVMSRHYRESYTSAVSHFVKPNGQFRHQCGSQGGQICKAQRLVSAPILARLVHRRPSNWPRHWVTRVKISEKCRFDHLFFGRCCRELKPAQRNSHGLWFVAIPQPVHHVKCLLDQPTGGRGIGLDVGRPGPRTPEIFGFQCFFRFFWPLSPVSSIEPNEIGIIHSHTVDRLPRKLSTGSAHRRPRNQLWRGDTGAILGHSEPPFQPSDLLNINQSGRFQRYAFLTMPNATTENFVLIDQPCSDQFTQ